MTTPYETLLVDVRGNGPRRAGVITLNRPKQLNALNDTLMDELGAALKAFDADDVIGCIVLTGSEKAFAAGADIATMVPLGFVDAYTKGLISRNWETIREIRKPVIAAVAGFATAQVLVADRSQLSGWLEPAVGQSLEDHLYIVDPQGDWMMRAPADPDPARLKRDVEKLLRASAGWDRPGR